MFEYRVSCNTLIKKNICNTFQVYDIEKIEDEVTPPPLKTIMFWNTFFGSSDFHCGLGQEPFKDAKCAPSDCFLTNKRSIFNQRDAIVFTWQNMNALDLPPYRFPHQRNSWCHTKWNRSLLLTPAHSRFQKYDSICLIGP